MRTAETPRAAVGTSALACALRERANVLHGVAQRLALEPAQRLPQQAAEEPYVVTQRLMWVAGHRDN